MMIHIIVFSMLAPVSTIHGRVFDAQTHQPVDGVRIVIQHLGVLIDTLYTDAEGRFDLAAAEWGRITISLSRDGFDPRTVEGSAIDSSFAQIDLMRRTTRPEIGPPTIAL